MLLTSVHHIYGAIIYQTPWRYHVVIPSIVAILFISGMSFLFSKRPDARLGALAFWLAIVSIIIFPILWIGLFEGGYNHHVKNALYFSGASMALMRRLFPLPTYEMPNDVFFEVTGALQLFAVLPAIYYTYRLIRAKVIRGLTPSFRGSASGSSRKPWTQATERRRSAPLSRRCARADQDIHHNAHFPPSVYSNS